MKLRQLEIFGAIMRTGSITAAARLLNLSQPSVSASLRHFEDQLGFQLLKRAKGRLRPTPEANVLYRHVQDVSMRVDGIMRVAVDLREGRGGVVAVAATPTMAATILAPAVAKFREHRPDVQVIFRTLSRYEVARRLASGETDFGLIQSVEQIGALSGEDILDNRIVCIMPKNHPLAKLDVIGPADVQPYPLISYHSDTVIGATIAKAFSTRSVTKAIDLQTSLSHTACMLAASGAGIAVFDPLGLRIGNFPELVQRPFVPQVRYPVKLLTTEDWPPSRTAERLIEYVRQHVATLRDSGVTRPGGATLSAVPVKQAG
jgi:DNA-binding transcriptional LysR family regulator